MTEKSHAGLTALKQGRHLPGPVVHSLYHVSGTLTTRTGLHIGDAESLAESDKVKPGEEKRPRNIQRVIREVDGPAGKEGAPYIPSTSLRGVARSFCDRMLAVLGAEYACPDGSGNIDSEEMDRYVRATDASETPKQAKHPDRLDRRRADYYRQHLDLVSGVFGMTSWRSKVEFDPGRIVAPGHDLVCLVPRVAIDPHLRSAENQKLFATELVRAGVSFQIRLRAQNLQPWELGLLLLAMDSFNHPYFPTRLGGNTAQGYGVLGWKLGTIERLDSQSAGGVLGSFIAAQRRQSKGEDGPGELLSSPGKFADQSIRALAETWAILLSNSAAS